MKNPLKHRVSLFSSRRSKIKARRPTPFYCTRGPLPARKTHEAAQHKPREKHKRDHHASARPARTRFLSENWTAARCLCFPTHFFRFQPVRAAMESGVPEPSIPRRAPPRPPRCLAPHKMPLHAHKLLVTSMHAVWHPPRLGRRPWRRPFSQPALRRRGAEQR